MSVCGKMISFWVRKVLGIAKAHMSSPVSSLAAGVILVSSLQAGEWPEFLLTSLQQISTRIPFSELSWDSVNSHLVDKCQTLIYIKVL